MQRNEVFLKQDKKEDDFLIGNNTSLHTMHPIHYPPKLQLHIYKFSYTDVTSVIL